MDNKPRNFILAVAPDFTDPRQERLRVLAEGRSRAEVGEQAVRILKAEHGRFWTTAQRRVRVGSREDILNHFRFRLSPEDLARLVMAFRINCRRAPHRSAARSGASVP